MRRSKLTISVGDFVTSEDIKNIKGYAITLHPFFALENGTHSGYVHEITPITNDMQPFYENEEGKQYVDKKDLREDRYGNKYMAYS